MTSFSALRSGMSPSPVLSSLTLFASLVSPHAASGQAWIAPPGEGSVSVSHQFVRSDAHLGSNGKANWDLGKETFHIVAVDLAYGIRDRLAVDATVAWMATKWVGHHPHGPLDTGIYHHAFQDARFAIRYQVAVSPVTISPFVAFGLPTHAYETRGHSAFGRNLKELQVGVSAGRSLRSTAGVAYVHASAAYAFSDRVHFVELDGKQVDAGFLGLDHFNGDFEVSAPVHRGISVRGFVTWQIMRDGLVLGPQTDHLELSPVHDRLGRAHVLARGSGRHISAWIRARSHCQRVYDCRRPERPRDSCDRDRSDVEVWR